MASKKTTKRIVKPIKKSKKKTVKKKVISKHTSKNSVKKIKKIPSKKVDSNQEKNEALPPKDVAVAGWKKKLSEKKHQKEKARQLRSKSDTWDKRKTEQEKTKRKRGIIMIVDGSAKCGKTKFSQTPEEFMGYNGKNRTLPPGKPVYVLDTENAAEDEAGSSLQSGDIIVKNVYVEDEVTKIIDPIASALELEEWAYALKDEESGTLVIDTFTQYCNWLKWELEEMKVGHNDDGTTKKKLGRFDWGWLYKRVDTFLYTLRNFKINVILVGKVKDEWFNPDPSNQYSAYKTGSLLTDAAKGFEYWVDVIARIEKVKNPDGSVNRYLTVEDSRFETVDMKDRKYELEGDPNFSDFINLIKDVLDRDDKNNG